MAYKSFSDKELSAALEVSGGVINAAAKILGVTRTAVWYRASGKGIAAKRRRMRLYSEMYGFRNGAKRASKEARMFWMHIWGMSNYEIAERFGFTHSHVAQSLRAIGLYSPRKKALIREERDSVRRYKT